MDLLLYHHLLVLIIIIPMLVMDLFELTLEERLNALKVIFMIL